MEHDLLEVRVFTLFIAFLNLFTRPRVWLLNTACGEDTPYDPRKDGAEYSERVCAVDSMPLYLPLFAEGPQFSGTCRQSTDRSLRSRIRKNIFPILLLVPETSTMVRATPL